MPHIVIIDNVTGESKVLQLEEKQNAIENIIKSDDEAERKPRKDSKKAESLINAYRQGYRITQYGEILNPKGNTINGVITIHKKMEYKHISTRSNGQRAHVFVHQLQAYHIHILF